MRRCNLPKLGPRARAVPNDMLFIYLWTLWHSICSHVTLTIVRQVRRHPLACAPNIYFVGVFRDH